MQAATIAVIVLAGLALALGVLALQSRRRWKAAEATAARAGQRTAALEARLHAAPLGCLTFAQDEQEIFGAPALGEALGLDLSNGVDLPALLGAFAEEEAERLARGLEELRREGVGFALRLKRKDGARVFEVKGGRANSTTEAAAADLLWLSDVTDLAQAAERAEAERDSVSHILDGLPLPVWRRDPDLSLVYCNQAYARAVDAAPGEALSQAVEILGKAKSEAGRAIGARALESGEDQTESHHVVVEGARRLLEVSEHPLADGSLLGHAVDRTDAEDLRGELSRRSNAHADVLENLRSGIAIFGPELKLRFFNSAYAEIWGLEEDFLRGEPEFGDVLEALREARRLPEQANFPEYKRQFARNLQTLINPTEELIHLPDGTTLLSVASPHPFGGVLLTYEDVTDRLSLESSYHTLIEVQRETLNNLYEGIAVYGADGRLRLSNPAFARIWKLPKELLETEPHVRELAAQVRGFFTVGDAEWEKLAEAIVARATEPEARSGRHERADGTIIDWSQVPLPDGASLFTFMDVTDSIRVERALRERAEALETADRLKSEFIANVSYELRTPLNAIVGFAEILEKQFFGELNERQLEYSRGIVESSEKLIALINDILDLATIEAGYLELEVEPVEVRDLLNSVRNLGQERARTQNIELKLDCPKDIGEITVDKRRLRQALFNLLSNAFKFTPEGGRVTVSARRGESEVSLTVTDTGIGIREEDLERVFGKFERGTGQSGQSGAGLGLSLVKSLVELHGGRVALESMPDSGTRVTCFIPADPAFAGPAADED
ncbi:MAG: PAS-domain containing protein [Kiloniellales bacterium]